MSHKPTVDLSNFYLFFWHDDMTILSKVSKADNFDSHKFQQFCWMWIVSWIKFSLFSCFIWDKLGRLIDSSKFAVVGYLPLIRKNSVTYMYGLAVFAGGRNFLFCRDWSLENSWRFLFMYSNGFTSLCVLHLVPYFFLLCWLPSSSLCMFFDDISSNIDEDFSINHLWMCLSLETLTFIIRNGYTFLVALIDQVNSVIGFLSQTTLFRWLTSLLEFPACDLHSPCLSDLFIHSNSSIFFL